MHTEREDYRKTNVVPSETVGINSVSSKSTQSSPNLDSVHSVNEAQKQTIQKLENEIKILTEALSSASQNKTAGRTAESETASVNQNEDTVIENKNFAQNISRQQMGKLLNSISNQKNKLLAQQFNHLRGIYKDDFDYIASLILPKSKKVELTQNEWIKFTAIDEKLRKWCPSLPIPRHNRQTLYQRRT